MACWIVRLFIGVVVGWRESVVVDGDAPFPGKNVRPDNIEKGLRSPVDAGPMGDDEDNTKRVAV